MSTTSDIRAASLHEEALPVLLTEGALARLLHLSPATLKRRRAAGDFIAHHRVGRRVLYSVADVMAHLAAVKVAVPQD